jgi:predicted secreted Zn-dependent protease
MKAVVLALLATFGLAPAAALALEKCVAPDGKISYVDRCPAGTTRAPSTTDERIIPKVPPAPVITKPELEPVPGALKPVPIPAPSPAEAAAPPSPPVSAPSATSPLAAPAAPAPVSTSTPPADVKVDYYDVEGADQPALVKALNARGGGHAKSAWKLSYQYQPRREKGMCGVGTVVTRLDLAMTLPRWTPQEGAPADLVQRWTKYVDALMAHENARLEKARELERELKPALEALPPAADCNALDAAVVERYEALQQKNRRDAEASEGASPVFE